MSGAIEWLEPVNEEQVPADIVDAGQRHPMRLVTRAAAAEVGAWTPETAARVQATFDELAGEWHTRHSPDRLQSLSDAFTRGGPLPENGLWLELGSGDGWATSTIAARAPALVSCDLSARMLALSGDMAPRLRADAAHLPLADHAVTVAVLMNMLLFPTELDRVLAPGGVLIWVSSRGEATPIHLMPEQVAAAMPGRWRGVAARHGTAIWSVLRRQG